MPNNIVRKYSKDLNYNQRLKTQAEKQIFFNQYKIERITAPKVIQINTENLYFFDMEYCTGKNYSQFFDNCSLSETHEILEIINNYFDFSINNSYPIENEIFKCKIISKLNSLVEFSEYKIIIQHIVQNYDSLKIENVRGSFCHGDLTFSNMLFSKNHVYFIDFLDSFIDSFYLDFAKIKQDLFYKWNTKINGDESLRIYQNFSYFWYNISERYSHFINTEAFDLLDFLNLLRIEPYVDDSNRMYLSECIQKHKYYVNFNNTNGRSILQIS